MYFRRGNAIIFTGSEKKWTACAAITREEITMENEKLQSRRDFMRTAGKIVLGAKMCIRDRVVTDRIAKMKARLEGEANA